MAAANTDKFKKLARRWVGSIGSGGVADESVTTIPLSSTTDLPTDTAVVAVIDRVDANGTATPSLEESVIGVVSGDNLVDCVRGAEGTAQAHSAGAVVEILVTAKGWNDMVDGFLAGHSQLGAHTTDTISEKTADAGVTVDGLLIKDGKIPGRAAIRVGSTDSSATPSIDTDEYEVYRITALATNITSFTTNLSGTPSDGQRLTITIKDNGTARTIAWGNSFASRGATLPTTTVASKLLSVGLIYNSATSTWDCIAVSLES